MKRRTKSIETVKVVDTNCMGSAFVPGVGPRWILGEGSVHIKLVTTDNKKKRFVECNSLNPRTGRCERPEALQWKDVVLARCPYLDPNYYGPPVEEQNEALFPENAVAREIAGRVYQFLRAVLPNNTRKD